MSALPPKPLAPLAPVPARDWLAVAEVGTVAGIRALAGIYRLCGRRLSHVALAVVVAYYTLLFVTGRRASFDYWRRIDGRPGWRKTYRHFFTFAVVALDRLLFAAGKTAAFELRPHGAEHIDALTAAGRGAILLGAHLGSFECLRARVAARRAPIAVVANFRNSARINGVLERLNPGLNTRVIGVDENGLDAVLRVREHVGRGELVAILADRARPGTRAITVDFLGGKARLPVGPFVLAAVLDCPVYLTFGLYRGGTRYDLHVEPFAERLVLPRHDREAALRAVAQRYADRLAEYVAMQPDNWFNFYRFWE